MDNNKNISENARNRIRYSRGKTTQPDTTPKIKMPSVAKNKVQNKAASPQPDQLEKTKQLCLQYKEQCQKMMAEFENYRNRTEKEKAGMYSMGVTQTIEKLLPVIDNFERALIMQKEQDNFYKGIQMILRQFVDILNSLGVEEIPAKGEKFDPNLHEAVAHEKDSSFGENEIMDVMQKGYRYKGKVIRHSMVKVAN